MADIKTSEVSKAAFLKLVDAYFGAKDHERWTKENGTRREYELAVEATREARDAMLRAVP